MPPSLLEVSWAPEMHAHLTVSSLWMEHVTHQPTTSGNTAKPEAKSEAGTYRSADARKGGCQSCSGELPQEEEDGGKSRLKLK